MPIGYINHPDFQSGVTSNDSWVNQILYTLGFASYPDQPERVTAQPSPIIAGKPYLIGAGSTYGTPGTLVVFLTTVVGSAMAVTPPDNFVAGKWTKSGSNWVQNVFTPRATVVYTATASVTLPATFDGVCQMVVDTTAGVTVSGASGRVNKGLAAVSITTPGVYDVYQSATTCIISPTTQSLADGDKGDITVSSSGSTWTIDNQAVSFAKMQNIPTNTLLGRFSAGTGSPEVYTLGSGLTVSPSGVISASGGGGGLSPWQIVTSSTYNASHGDRLRVDCSSGDVIIYLPSPPSASGADIWIQKIDNSTNKVIVNPSGSRLRYLNSQLGVFNPGATNIDVMERFSYVNATVGWLAQEGRLTYIVGDPLDSNTVFYVVFEGSTGSTTFTDQKGNTISIRSGTPQISAAQSVNGNGSIYLDGLSSLQVAANATFASGTGDFDLELALYPTVFTAGENQGLFDRRSSISPTPDAATFNNTSGVGFPTYYNGTVRIAPVSLKLNQWGTVRFSRYQGITTFYLDDIPIYSAVDTANYSNTGNWVLFDIIDTISPNGGMFTGYCQWIRDTRVSRRQGYNGFPSLNPVSSDPLEAFKVLDINAESGTIIDTKGHTITQTGAITASTSQKRAGSYSLALTGGYLDVAGGTDFNFGSAPYSIHASGWLSSVGTSGGNSPDIQYLFDFDSSDTSALAYTSAGGTPRWAIANAAAFANSFNETPAVNTWYDMTLAKIGNFYLLMRNNQIVAASNNAPTTANYSTMRVGSHRLVPALNVQGFMDSISVYKGAANGSNLTHNYQLQFLARFESGINDELGATGVLTGSATYSTTKKRSLASSLILNGSSRVTYPSISAYDVGSGGFEIAGWFNAATSQNAISGLMTSGIVTGSFDSQSWGIYTNVTGGTTVTGRTMVNKVGVYVAGVSTINGILASTTSINDDTPHYFRIIKYIIGSSAVTVLILDGRIEDVYIGNYTVAATTRGLVIGNEGNTAGRGFQGNIDDIALYK